MKLLSILAGVLLGTLSVSAQAILRNYWTTNNIPTNTVSHGGTGVGNLSSGAVLIGNGTGPVLGAATNQTNYVLHGGALPFFGPIDPAEVGTNFGAVRFSVEPINSSLIFDAVTKETSGYVSNGLTALTVTGGSFVAGDVGKTIQVWQPDRVFTDAIITNATAKLVSATAAFTAVDLGKTVEVSGAGPTSFSLLSTISSVDSATQVTLAANASTTVSNVSARIISVPLVTTIAAVGGATTATLNAAPGMTHTNAHVIYGTDNRVALSNDCAAAQLARRNIKLGSGKALVLLTTANPWATALSTNDLNIVGTSKGTTEIVMITDAIPSVAGGIFRVNTSASLRARDFTVRCYSPNTTNNVVASGFPMAFYMAGGGSTQYMSLEHVDIFGAGNATFISSGSANTRKMWAQDCRWVTIDITSCFFVSDPGVYERRMRDCYLETDNPITTTSNDTQYNCHTVYDHPAVAEDWTDGQFYSLARAGGAYHIHHYGGSVAGCSFIRFNRCKFSGLPNAVYSATTGVVTEFIEPIFEQSGNGALVAGDAAIYGGRTRATNQTSILTPLTGTTGEHFTVIGHDFLNTNTLGSLIASSVSGMDVYVSGSYITGLAETSTATSNKSVYVGTTFVGQNPTVAQAFAAAYAGTSLSNGVAKFLGCYFKGDFHDECIRFRLATNFDLEVSDCRNDTARPLVHDTTSGGGTGAMAYGHDNYYPVSGGEPQSDTRLGSHFSARNMVNPTAIASASTINPSFNFDTHKVSGSTTINTILVGGDATRNVMASEVTLVASAAATWAVSSAGNVVPLTTAARVAGQAYTFRWDSIDQKWRELGFPGGEVFTNAPNLFSANASNTYNGPVRMVGRRQFSWTTLGGTTIDGSTNSLTTTLTANTTLNWTGVDGDEVTLEVLQDGIGGWTLAINNVDVWWNHLTQSTTMPLINTNAGLRTYITLSRIGTTDLGSVVSSPSQWEADLLAQNITSAQLFQALSDEIGASGKAIRVNASGQTNGQAVVWNGADWTNGTVAASGIDLSVFNPTQIGTNGNVVSLTNTVRLTNAYIYGPLTFPIATQDTNINWAASTKSAQGITTNESFTLKFLNSPPVAGSAAMYSISNSAASNIVVTFAGTGITNSYEIKSKSIIASKTVVAGSLTWLGWFYDGSTYVMTSDEYTPTVTIPTGTVVNTGASAASQVPRYTDTTGTNVAPSLAQVDAVGGVTITNTANTNVALTVNGFSGTTNDVAVVRAGGTNYFKVNSKGQILTLDGTTAAPAFSFLNAPDTGFKWRNPGLSFSVGNSEKMIVLAGGVTVTQPLDVNAGNLSQLSFAGDTFLVRDASAAVLQMGVDAASPIAQLFKGPDGLGADKAGGSLTIAAGTSTGTGAAGPLIFKSGETSTTSSTTNGSVVRFYVSAKGVDLTGGSATLVFNISLASGKTCGLHVFATTRVNDGTDFQSATDDFTAAAVNKGGTVTIGSISTSLGSTVATSGTISTVWTAVANGNGIDVKCNQTSTVITPTVRKVKWRVEVDTDDTAAVITPQ